MALLRTLERGSAAKGGREVEGGKGELFLRKRIGRHPPMARRTSSISGLAAERRDIVLGSRFQSYDRKGREGEIRSQEEKKKEITNTGRNQCGIF